MAVPFLKMFLEYEPDEPLRAALEQASIVHAEIDREARSVLLRLELPRYVPESVLNTAAAELSKLYGMRRVRFEPHYPPEALAEFDGQELTRALIDAYSPAAAILAGCKWSFAGERVELYLRANGRDQLTPHLPAAERLLTERFGVRMGIDVISNHEPVGEELFAETEKMRLAALRDVPVPSAPAGKPQGGKDAKPAAPSQTIYGKPFHGNVTPMRELSQDSDVGRVIVEGRVFAVNHKELKKRNAWVVNFDMTDYTGSIRVNRFMEADQAKPLIDAIQKPGKWLRVQGFISFSRFENDIVLEPLAVQAAEAPVRVDTAPEKRVELHLHTTMSMMDALTKTGEAVATAARWGHRAIAITDHGVASSFPAALNASKNKVAGTDQNIKILYGCEGYYVNDVDDRIAVHGTASLPLDGEFVAFDLETTGLSAQHDEITEIGAVILRDGQVVDTFQAFVNPGRSIPQKIVDLTGITDAMVADAPPISQVLPEFLAFCGGRVLCAHNADFDVGFLTAAAERLGLPFDPTYLDTLIFAQNLMPQLTNHKLDTVANALSLPDFNHHRASDDALTCGYLYLRFAKMLQERGLHDIQDINADMLSLRAGSRITNRHILLFAKNQMGLRNLYRLISDSNLKYFKRTPRIPKSELIRFREGLIIGSACEAGELFQAIVAHKSHAELKRIASFYDFLEIQPLSNNRFMLAKGIAESDEELREFNRTVVRLGEELGKPVCATGDVHFLNPEDEIYRRILLATKGFEDCDRENPLYFRTTDEMLEEFSYLGPEKAYEVVVKNPNHIADMCETVRPVPHNLFAPKIKNSVEDLKSLVYGKLHRLYGDNPPEIVTKRVETELGDIINCHYDVIYMSAQKLVQNSLEHGYLVGSRGSVGSSLVAYFSGITEVNSLPPHYVCPQCKYTDFDSGAGFGCGADMPDKVCPRCGAKLRKDGFDIPFETFLGFGGDKVPDIDLNFSGEYQAKAHKYTEELFGSDHVFRAGTIGTLAEKTAYGYVLKYLEERGKTLPKAEMNRLALGCVGVKRTTGQHPGGLVVIPQDKDVTDFCPVQHPADDPNSDIITTHFEYHCMEANLLKLDELGHDDPTMIRMLEDMTGVNAREIPLDDPDTMGIFCSAAPLGLTDDDPIVGKTGTIGIPEFGTGFTRQMLVDTQPKGFDILVRLSGFSHGTDVWLGNAKDLIMSGTATVNQTVGCRDDIMLYLISRGMDAKLSFKIMESVRKGKVKRGGFQDGWVETMEEHGVPEWYITSLSKIAYLFPKAHAVAYVMMAFRIAWFKVHEPLAFYSAYFYRRSQKDSFDADMMTRGLDYTRRKINELRNKPTLTAKEEDLLVTLEAVYEFNLRGFEFAPMSLYESDATKFLIRDGKLLPPFVAISGLGESAAWNLVACRADGREFVSVEELSAACPKVSQTHLEQLRAMGALGEMPDSSQMSLF